MSSRQFYQDWTLVQLKAELKGRNAKQSGRKQELVARLQFLDVNQPSTIQSAPEVEFSMTLPETHLYKDIHAGVVDTFPNLVTARVDEYLGQFDQTLTEKSKALYKERFIQFVRLVMPDDDSDTYVTAKIWAEMKKAASYKVDLSLNKDAVVQQAQCECGAGQGPTAHCKHIAALLFGLICFKSTHHILTELTCTQVLQTFHKTKAFKGSPMKAGELQVIRGKEGDALVYDPRPEHLRNCASSSSRFRNLCLNYTHQGDAQSMPVLQLIPPANPHALAHDHDYLKHSPEDQYLVDNMVSAVTLEQTLDIEKATRGQAANKKWREIRLHHLTSSNFGTICKATEKKDMVKLARSLTNHQDLKSAPILHGRKYEVIAVELFEKKTGMTTKECGIFVSHLHPEIAASPDRLIDSSTILEVKCPYTARDKNISPITVPYLVEENGTLSLSKTHDYYYQIQGQLFCAQRSEGLLAVYTLKDFSIVTVPRDDKFIEIMISKLLKFYTTHFKEAVLDKFFYKNYHQYNLSY